LNAWDFYLADVKKLKSNVVPRKSQQLMEILIDYLASFERGKRCGMICEIVYWMKDTYDIEHRTANTIRRLLTDLIQGFVYAYTPSHVRFGTLPKETNNYKTKLTEHLNGKHGHNSNIYCKHDAEEIYNAIVEKFIIDVYVPSLIVKTEDKACQTEFDKTMTVEEEQLERDKAFARAFEFDWSTNDTKVVKVVEKKQDSDITQIKNDVCKILQMMNAVYEFENA